MSGLFKNLFASSSLSEGTTRSSQHVRASQHAHTPQHARAASPTAVDYRNARRNRYVANVLYLQDTSGSVGQEALDYVFPSGVQSMVDELRRSLPADTTACFGVMTFSTRTKLVLPFTPIDDLGAQLKLPNVKASGVTNMEDALWEAFLAIDKLKKEQDDAGILRAGTLLAMSTDGKPTDADGNRYDPVTDERIELSKALVEEIVERNRTRKTATFAVGIGNVDDETLLQLGPSDASGGVVVPRAVRYVGGNESDSACWSAICHLIGRASSSSTGKLVLAYEGDQADWFRDMGYDVIDLSSDQYQILA